MSTERMKWNEMTKRDLWGKLRIHGLFPCRRGWGGRGRTSRRGLGCGDSSGSCARGSLGLSSTPLWTCSCSPPFLPPSSSPSFFFRFLTSLALLFLCYSSPLLLTTPFHSRFTVFLRLYSDRLAAGIRYPSISLTREERPVTVLKFSYQFLKCTIFLF